jgi:hypothetical protein
MVALVDDDLVAGKGLQLGVRRKRLELLVLHAEEARELGRSFRIAASALEGGGFHTGILNDEGNPDPPRSTHTLLQLSGGVLFLCAPWIPGKQSPRVIYSALPFPRRARNAGQVTIFTRK